MAESGEPTRAFMKALPADTVLIVIDVQQAFDHPRWGHRNNPDAEANVARLLTAWRAQGRPVIHVHHCNPAPESRFNPGSPGVAVKPEALPLPGEPMLYKRVNSAFIGTDLEQRLRCAGAETLVMVGLTTDHCVSTSTRMAGNLGFDTYIVADATATFDRTGPDGKLYPAELMHDTALASLHGEFAQVVSTAQILEALAANS
jgi:nicotinamidase-related amidase